MGAPHSVTDVTRSGPSGNVRPVPLQTEANEIHAADFFTVWRRGDVVGVRIFGELNDARNPVWRSWLDTHFAQAGWPRFVALDVRDAVPMATLPRRIQTAMWGRLVLSRIEQGVLAVGKDARVGLTVGAILRVTRMTNVTVCSRHEDFCETVDSWLGPSRT